MGRNIEFINKTNDICKARTIYIFPLSSSLSFSLFTNFSHPLSQSVSFALINILRQLVFQHFNRKNEFKRHKNHSSGYS